MREFEHISASPLTWPAGWARAKLRKRAKFHAGGGGRRGRDLTVSDGTMRINNELRALGVKNGGFIVSTNLQLRIDGLPRSGQGEPRDPGAAVYWRTDRADRELVMAIDIYDRVADNLGAIAASLEALRAIERHGGAQILERAFTGFVALPAPKSCWQILHLGAGASIEAIETAWRRKIRELRSSHPGGDHPDEAALNAARDEALRLAASGVRA